MGNLKNHQNKEMAVTFKTKRDSAILRAFLESSLSELNQLENDKVYPF